MIQAARRRGPLIGLIAGHAVSLTGNMLTLIAVPLYVLATTNSATATGIAGACATAPVIIGGAFGGVFVDRIGYQRASIIADLFSGTTTVAVPVLVMTVGLPFWGLLALVFLAGLLDTPGQTARSALLPEAAATAGVPLERAVGLYEASERLARLVGAPVAGLLVTLFGALNVLLVDAGTFLASAAIVAAFVRLSPQRRVVTAAASRPERTSYWRDLKAGVKFVVGDRLLRAVVLLVLVTNLFDAAKSTVLLPVSADRQLGGATAFGILVGVTAAGALGGSLGFSMIGHRLPRRASFVIAFACAGPPPFLALAAGLPLPALIPIFLVSGFAAGGINPTIGSIKLERVPAGMRARVYGVIGAGAWLAMPLGSLLAGLSVSHLGLAPTLIIVGFGYLLAALTPLAGGAWHEMSERPPREEPVPSAAG